MSLTASGLPIDGESLLRFKKHHAPVTFEATRAAVVLDTLSFLKTRGPVASTPIGLPRRL